MKYNENNKPLICMQTQSTCYRGTRTMTVRGVLWHSTGANNPNLLRYVQPSDNAPDKEKMLQIIGVNKYKNDINHITRNMGMNAWIGKLANGEIATIQTMPWNYKPWGCGNGGNGSCNEGWIQFEICEDDLQNKDYAMAVYREACQLTAYLCKMYNLNPKGQIRFNNVMVPIILDHTTSNSLGLGSNHGDIKHWFPKFGKTLVDIRNDVLELLNEDSSEPTIPQPTTSPSISLGNRSLRKGMSGEDVKELQEALIKLGYNLGNAGADGIFGNKTDDAVRSFQQSAGLTVDGIFGAKSYEALLKKINASIPLIKIKTKTEIRDGNNIKYNIIKTANINEKYEYVATAANGWIAIVTDNKVGWILSDCCEKV